MAEVAEEFSRRLQQALDSHPHAPAGQYGRLTWLQRELEKQSGTKVSVNTVHKWYHGTSLPRPDNIRAIARVLKVDEVWLTLGRSPQPSAEPVEVQVGRANGAVLIVAGLIELAGGRVTFPTEKAQPHLQANLGTARFAATVVVGNEADGQISCLVPEPVGSSRVLLLRARVGRNAPSVAFDIYDITAAPRQTFGGYALAQFAVAAKGEVTPLAGGAAIRALPSIEALSASENEPV